MNILESVLGRSIGIENDNKMCLGSNGWFPCHCQNVVEVSTEYSILRSSQLVRRRDTAPSCLGRLGDNGEHRRQN